MRQVRITKSITNRDSLSLEKYLKDIHKIEQISAEDEVSLTERIKEGNELALNRLIQANLRFVVSVAKQYQNQGLSLNDLINEGNVGLIKAAQRFDQTRGFKFISYAVWWIRQSILQALAENSRLIRIPLNRVGDISKIQRAFSQLEQEFEREPTPEEIAEVMDLKVKDIISTIKATSKPKSFDSPLQEGEGGSLIDIIKDPNAKEVDEALEKGESLKIELNTVLNLLNERQRTIVRLYFGLDSKYAMSLEDIGHQIGLTRERVRQIKDKALIRLRSHIRSQGLRDFLAH